MEAEIALFLIPNFFLFSLSVFSPILLLAFQIKGNISKVDNQSIFLHQKPESPNLKDKMQIILPSKNLLTQTVCKERAVGVAMFCEVNNHEQLGEQDDIDKVRAECPEEQKLEFYFCFLHSSYHRP